MPPRVSRSNWVLCAGHFCVCHCQWPLAIHGSHYQSRVAANCCTSVPLNVFLFLPPATILLARQYGRISQHWSQGECIIHHHPQHLASIVWHAGRAPPAEHLAGVMVKKIPPAQLFLPLSLALLLSLSSSLYLIVLSRPPSSLPHMLDHSGSFGWSTGEVPSTSTRTSTGKSTGEAKHNI